MHLHWRNTCFRAPRSRTLSFRIIADQNKWYGKIANAEKRIGRLAITNNSSTLGSLTILLNRVLDAVGCLVSNTCPSSPKIHGKRKDFILISSPDIAFITCRREQLFQTNSLPIICGLPEGLDPVWPLSQKFSIAHRAHCENVIRKNVHTQQCTL